MAVTITAGGLGSVRVAAGEVINQGDDTLFALVASALAVVPYPGPSSPHPDADWVRASGVLLIAKMEEEPPDDEEGVIVY